MRTIHLKLPNEKQNEASLTERGFSEREGEQDGRWPIVSNVISILVDGFPMWVSCTRASGCLQSYMIYSWLLGEPPHTLACSHTHMHRYRRETESETEQRVIHMLDYQNLPDRHGNRHSALEARHAGLSPALALCPPEVPVNQCALALPLAQQLWYLPWTGPIMAVNPADAPGTKHGAL